jgi:hypothetical protein
VLVTALTADDEALSDDEPSGALRPSKRARDDVADLSQLRPLENFPHPAKRHATDASLSQPIGAAHFAGASAPAANDTLPTAQIGDGHGAHALQAAKPASNIEILARAADGAARATAQSVHTAANVAPSTQPQHGSVAIAAAPAVGQPAPEADGSTPPHSSGAAPQTCASAHTDSQAVVSDASGKASGDREWAGGARYDRYDDMATGGADTDDDVGDIPAIVDEDPDDF